jgi:hypothetical protein
MSTGPSQNVADLDAAALADDLKVAADQQTLATDTQTDTVDNQALSDAVVKFPKGVFVLSDPGAGQGVLLTSDGGPKVTRTPIPVFTPTPPQPPTPTPAPAPGGGG